MTSQDQEDKLSGAGPVLGRVGWTSAACLASGRSYLRSEMSLRVGQGSGPAGCKTQEDLGLQDVAKAWACGLDAT